MKPTIVLAIKNIETTSAFLTNLLHELGQGQEPSGYCAASGVTEGVANQRNKIKLPETPSAPII